MAKTKKEELVQQINELISTNEEFCKALISAEDATSAQKVLNANGLDASLDDVQAIFEDGKNEILKVKEAGTSDELSEDQLDNIAGGGLLKGILVTAVSSVAAFGYGMVCAAVPAASAAALYVGGTLAGLSTKAFVDKGW